MVRPMAIAAAALTLVAMPLIVGCAPAGTADAGAAALNPKQSELLDNNLRAKSRARRFAAFPITRRARLSGFPTRFFSIALAEIWFTAIR